VQRQYAGCVGKKENCIVTVHLGYASDDFHCLLDGELFLPESWAADRPRCREAGIPDTVVYRPKWRIALELYDRASAHGLRFAWLTFDEGYGGKPEFLREVSARQQKYVAEVPRSLSGWLKAPRVVTRCPEPVTSSVDYKLYRNDPERAYHMFATEEYPGGLSWLG